MIYHNSQELYCRSPFGAAAVSSNVTIRVTADYACGAVLRLWTEENGEKLVEMQRSNPGEFIAELTMPDHGTLIWYYFIIYYPDGNSCLYGAPFDDLGGTGQEYRADPKSFQITVYKPSAVPAWYRSSVMYQIFPDRFARGSDFESNAAASGKHITDDWYSEPYYIKNELGDVNDWIFYGGSLKGIEEKLDYLKELGVGAIYLNPIFKARSNHRYDTADYTKIDPLLGDEESFVSLCREAEAKGIGIIFDGVFSHAGRHSIYFEEGSPYRKWFKFSEDGSCKCWWGVKDLPEINESDPDFNEYICGDNGVLHKWLSCGASGVRLDVADELPDAFIKNVRARIKKEKESSVLIGEVWEDASNKFSHGEHRKYLMGDELDSTMNYPLRAILIDFALGNCDAFTTARRFMSLMENYPSEQLYSAMNLLSSHDRERILTVLGSDTDKLRMLYALLFCLPGVPCIYYGDEAGLEGETDPANRAAYPWGRENEELLIFFKGLCADYHRHSALKDGSFKPVFLANDVFSFIRKNDEESLLVLANASDEERSINFKGQEYVIPAFRTIYRAF